MNSIRILADDLTGALDTAASFSGEIPVFIDSPPVENSAAYAASISVLATPTRDIPTDEVGRYLKPALEWLNSGEIAFKKVDSLLRGNTFTELAWLIRSGVFDRTLFAPAFPAQGRITTEGQQWVIEPGKLSSPRKAVATPFGEALAGFGIRTESNNKACSSSSDVWAPDILSDQDMDAVVAMAESDGSQSRLWCGSAGLAQALARRHGLSPDSSAAPSRPPVSNEGATVLITASHHPVLRQQWALMQSALTPQALAQHANDSQIAAALELAGKGAMSVWFDLSPTETISLTDAARLLGKQMAQLTSTLPKPAQLIIVGGDTLLSVCRTTRTTGLLAQASVRSGWGCARLIGGLWNDVPCYSRSGAFGGTDDLLAMVQMLDSNITPNGETK